MKFVLTVAIAVAVLAALVIPAAPASANSQHSTCSSVGPDWAKRCVALEFSGASLRAIGSLNDLAGNGTVAVFAFVQYKYTSCGDCGWSTRPDTSPRLEARGFVLTATPWMGQVPKNSYRAVLNWNYRNGQNSGRIVSPIVNV